MASIITDKWVSTSPQVKFIVEVAENTATYVKYNWKVQYIASYAASTNTARSWTAKIDDGTATGTYSINGKTGTNTIKTGTKKVNKGTSAKTISYSVSMDIKLTWSGSYKGTISKSGTLSVGAKTSYKVTYNANGGSGAPGQQTKWHGTNLTLSSTKPTRSGYTFMGWGTSASTTTVSYAAGATYSSNAAITLYAIWRKTITVSYNANGGAIGSIANQSVNVYNATTSASITLSNAAGPTKSGYTFLGWSTSASATSATYAKGKAYTFSSSVTLYAIWKKTLTVSYNANGGIGAPSAVSYDIFNSTTSKSVTLSSTIPTRANHDFLGWSTSSTGGVTHNAGGTYTISSNLALYAVWKLAYVEPRIIEFTVTRCTIDGTDSDEGTYGKLSFLFMTDREPETINISYPGITEPEEIQCSVVRSEVSGKYIYNGQPVGTNILGTALTNPFSLETSTTFTLTVSDELGETSVDYILKPMTLALDLYAGGKGVAVGKPATKEGFECEFPAYFNNDLTIAYPKMIYGYNYSTGALQECFCPQSSSGTTSLGYGGYAAKTGQTKVFGNAVEILSNSGVSVAGNTSITGTLTTSSNSTIKGNTYFGNGTYFINSGGGANLYNIIANSTITGKSSDNWLGKHRFCGEWIGMYNTVNGGTRKGYIGHDGSTHLYIVNENGGSTYYNTGANHYFNKGVLISSGNLGSQSAYTSGFAMYGKWRDGSNHDIIGKSTDGLGCFLGWVGSSSYASVCTIRGRTCRYTNSSGTTNLSDRNLKKDFESFSDAHDIFFDNLNPTTYKYILGSSGRSHFGYITQEVEEALEEAGLTTKDFGGVNIVKLTSRETEKDDETGEINDIEDSADNYLLDRGIKEQHNLVYTEFISLNTWQIQKLKKRVNEQDEIIKSQQAQIDELKSLVQQLLNQ